MEFLVERWTTILMVGIVVVVGVSQIDRIVGAWIGVGFWIMTAVLGHFVYAAGAGIGFPGALLPEWMFLLLCASFIGLQFLMIRTERAKRARKKSLAEERLS
ncbi:MAG: hypothetical protein ACFB9M_14185 [Myxococcota bacterium]